MADAVAVSAGGATAAASDGSATGSAWLVSAGAVLGGHGLRPAPGIAERDRPARVFGGGSRRGLRCCRVGCRIGGGLGRGGRRGLDLALVARCGRRVFGGLGGRGLRARPLHRGGGRRGLLGGNNGLLGRIVAEAGRRRAAKTS